MPRSPFKISSLVVLALLACSAIQPDPTSLSNGEHGDAARPEPGVHGPNAVEWVEAHFLSQQSGLGAHEIRLASETIVEQSAKHDVPLDLMLAVIHLESGFHNFARSRVGALGLMQIMPGTGEALARELDIGWNGPATLFQPVENVRMGTHYLRFLHTRYGSWELALAAYNWGPAAIDRRLRRGHGLPALYISQVYSRLQSPDAL
jgi:soluble lytic murein transglycosylase-like protein